MKKNSFFNSERKMVWNDEKRNESNGERGEGGVGGPWPELYANESAEPLRRWTCKWGAAASRVPSFVLFVCFFTGFSLWLIIDAGLGVSEALLGFFFGTGFSMTNYWYLVRLSEALLGCNRLLPSFTGFSKMTWGLIHGIDWEFLEALIGFGWLNRVLWGCYWLFFDIERKSMADYEHWMGT